MKNKINMDKTELPGFIFLAKETLKVYKDKWRVLISIFLLTWVAMILATLTMIGFIAIAKVIAPASLLSAAIVGAVILLPMVFLGISWIYVAAIIAIKERSANIKLIELLRRAKPKVFAYFWVSVLGGIAIAAGMIFFALPGIIIAVWIFAAGIIAATEDKRGIAALAQSREYARGYFLKIFLLMAAGIFLFFFFNSIIEAIGNNLIQSLISLAIMPIPIIFSYLIFEKLKQIKGDLPEPTAEQKSFFRIVAGIGLAIVIALIALAINFAPEIKQEYEIMRLQYEAETDQELPPLPI